MKKFFEEFKTFITKGNVLDMAVGVIIGAAFGAITTSLVNNVINPLLAWLFKAPDFTKLNITLRAADEAAGTEALVLGIGIFINAILNFLIVAFVLFLVIKAFNKAKEMAEAKKKKEEEEAKPEEPAGPTTEELLTDILAELKKK